MYSRNTNYRADRVPFNRPAVYHHQRALAYWLIRDHGRRCHYLRPIPHLRRAGPRSIGRVMILLSF